MKTALSIAGSDCSGGAGIQADIKTMTLNGVYAMSAVTALTAQNTLGVHGVSEVSTEFLKDQIDAVFEDIRPDAVKIGMIPSRAHIEIIAERLKHYGAENIVADPVMISTSGTRLMSCEAIECLTNTLLPLCELITPNIPEAEVLSEIKINTKADAEKAALKLWERLGCNVLIKGGHFADSSDDLLLCGGSLKWFKCSRIASSNTHGTGCTLSSAAAANLAKGFSLEEAVERAKEYITGAIAAGLDLGKGNGPLDHAFDIKSRFINKA